MTKQKLWIFAAALSAGILMTGAFACVGASDMSSDAASLNGSGSIVSVSAMSKSRAAHTATLLPNGKVLIAGGFYGEVPGLATAEIYDPETKAFTAAENMSVARASHTATLLKNGKVLIAGGYNGEYLNTAEIYDPATGKFAAAGKMTTARSGQIAVLLNDGKVLLAGGVGTGWTFLADAEIYDPETNAFSKTGAMTVERESHTATLLNNGKVLITGGHKGRRSDVEIFASTEIYDPATGKFSANGDLTIRRHKHDAVLLADGRVLIIGGSDERDSAGAYRNSEIFDPAKAAFTAVKQDMNSTRYKLQGTAILLKSGKVLVAGGSDRAEIFDPKTNMFSAVKGELGSKRLFATATLLQNGQVLITGGYDSSITASDRAWVYRA